MAAAPSRSIICSSGESSEVRRWNAEIAFVTMPRRWHAARLETSRSFAVNVHTKTSPATAVSTTEWQARVDLAAVYRLVAHHGWDDVIYNHCSMRAPGEERKFLMKRHELLWTEV